MEQKKNVNFSLVESEEIGLRDCFLQEDSINLVRAKSPLSLVLKLPEEYRYEFTSSTENEDWGIRVTFPNGSNIWMCMGCHFTAEISECGFTGEHCTEEKLFLGGLEFVKSVSKEDGLITSLRGYNKNVDILVNLNETKILEEPDIGYIETVLSCTHFPDRKFD